jgi:hypothetical protein
MADLLLELRRPHHAVPSEKAGGMKVYVFGNMQFDVAHRYAVMPSETTREVIGSHVARCSVLLCMLRGVPVDEHEEGIVMILIGLSSSPLQVLLTGNMSWSSLALRRECSFGSGE